MSFISILAAFSFIGVCFGQRLNITDEEALEKAYEVLQQYPLVDGHNDLPYVYRRRVENDVESIDLDRDVNGQWGNSHTDIPRLREGMLGSQFWSVFVSCGKQYIDAVRATLEQIDVVKRFVSKHPDHFQLVTSAQGILDAFSDGKIGSLIGMEGGHSIDSSLATLRMMYDLGARYMTLTHSCTTPWIDNSRETDAEVPDHNGLTVWGQNVIKEMNRIGMLVDLSHVSHKAMRDVLNVTEAPIIFSHSNAWSLCRYSRNVPDDVLRATAENGGIVMVTFVPFFLACYPSDDREVNVELVADHIEYIRDVAGIDHVGIGGDYDGVGSLPIGLEDVSKYPNLFAELVKRDWSDLDMQKVAGRNLVRVLERVEMFRDEQLANGVNPYNEWISFEDIENRTECRTTF